MTAKEIRISIKARTNHLNERKVAASKAIDEGAWLTAQNAIIDCIRDEAIIDELNFALEVKEVRDHD